MKRIVLNELVAWKNKDAALRKPLILEGARQVGKTWLARELGGQAFAGEYIEVNFEDNENLRTLFEADFDMDRILMAIQSATGKHVVPGKTLLFFDEIQHAHRGLLALKYFYDKLPHLHIIAAGSLLGVMNHKDDSFPVGKVDFLRVSPMGFEEFLMALGKDGLVDILHSLDSVSINAFSAQFEDLLRQYYFVGGMPEVVKTYVEQRDYAAVRKVQKAILTSYEKDFSKHPPKELIPRMTLLWNSIPAQLAKENKKFVYSAVKSGARAREYEAAITWLCNAGLIYKVTRVRAGELPLRAFEDMDAFKLYVLDIGLHGAMSGLSARTLITGNDFFKQYKGALTEQFVLQELQLISDVFIHYWTPDVGTAEVDFVLQLEDEVVPIEVKAEQNLHAKSLRRFIDEYNPIRTIRTSMAPMSSDKRVIDLPLYAFSQLQHLIIK